MSSIQEKTNELAELIKQTEHYAKVKELSPAVRSNEEYMKMIEAYNMKQMELQNMKNAGQQISEDDYRVMNQLYISLMENEEIKGLFEAEEQLNKVMNDILAGLSESMKDLYGEQEAEQQEQ